MLCREKTACFTGHRQLRDPIPTLFSKTEQEAETLIRNGYRFFGAGGARGFDSLAAEVMIKLKEKYPHIHLILVLPFPRPYTHEKGWNEREIVLHERQIQYASKVVYLQQAYSSGCYYKRNRRLVDFSSVCIAYQYKATGGTAYTTRYAQNRGLRIILI